MALCYYYIFFLNRAHHQILEKLVFEFHRILTAAYWFMEYFEKPSKVYCLLMQLTPPPPHSGSFIFFNYNYCYSRYRVLLIIT